MIPFVDIIGYVAAAMGSFAALPQLFKIIKTKHTSDISLLFILIITTSLLLWLIYGILIVAWPIILANIVASSFWLVILLMKLKYK